MTASAVFLFGLVRIPMWNYYWGYTAAQVELAVVDGPVIVYHRGKDKEGGRPKPTGAAIERAALEYEKEKRENGGRITVNLSKYKIQ